MSMCVFVMHVLAILAILAMACWDFVPEGVAMLIKNVLC